VAYNNRHQKRALWALDSQQVARVCGGLYVFQPVESGWLIKRGVE